MSQSFFMQILLMGYFNLQFLLAMIAMYCFRIVGCTNQDCLCSASKFTVISSISMVLQIGIIVEIWEMWLLEVFQFWLVHCNFGSFLLYMLLNAYFIPQDRFMCSGQNSFWICYLVTLICFHPLLSSALLGTTLWHVLLDISYAKDVKMQVHSLGF